MSWVDARRYLDNMAAKHDKKVHKNAYMGETGVSNATLKKLLAEKGWQVVQPRLSERAHRRRAIFDKDHLPLGPCLVTVFKHIIYCVDGEIRDQWNSMYTGKKGMYFYAVPTDTIGEDTESFWDRADAIRFAKYGRVYTAEEWDGYYLDRFGRLPENLSCKRGNNMAGCSMVGL